MIAWTGSVDTGIAKRDEHLRTSDYFDVANHPNLTFTTTSVRFDDPTTAQVTGDLSLNGRTRTIDFVAKVVVAGTTAAVNAEFTIDRRDWDISLVRMGAGVINRVEVNATFTRDR